MQVCRHRGIEMEFWSRMQACGRRGVDVYNILCLVIQHVLVLRDSISPPLERYLYLTLSNAVPLRKIWLCTAVSRACCRAQSSLPSQSSLPPPELAAASRTFCRFQSFLPPPELAAISRAYYRC